jgi:hypothetical protein
MPEVAPTREDLAARLRRPGADDPQPVTADDLRAGWCELFEACVMNDNYSSRPTTIRFPVHL